MGHTLRAVLFPFLLFTVHLDTTY